MAAIVIATLALGCGRIGYGALSDGESMVDGGDPMATDADSTATDADVLSSNTVFVASSLHVAGALGEAGDPHEFADSICADRASEAGLVGTFVAFLSTSTLAASSKIAGARGWHRTDGLPVADRVEDLFAAKIFYPIALDENAVAVSEFVVTGTSNVGGPDRTCSDYTSTTTTFTFGLPWGTTNAWADYVVSIALCDGAKHLYCFGVDRNSAIVPPTATGPVAFVTSSNWASGGGLGDADAFCQSEAAGGGLTGEFRALLATSTESASSRFDLDGDVWVRPDGVRLAGSRAQFMAAETIAPITVTASGEYHGELVLTGADSPLEVGELFDTCDDWTSNEAVENGGYSRSGLSGEEFFVAGVRRAVCSEGGRLYCLQTP
jgi:hypothetical protein